MASLSSSPWRRQRNNVMSINGRRKRAKKGDEGTAPTSMVEEEIGNILRQNKLTLGAAESATGGLLSHRITSIPGSSDYYKGSITAYSNEIKVRLVGVKEDTIRHYGAVSASTAEEMATGARKLLRVDICISDTGIAGPGGATPDKPVGLFFSGLSSETETLSQKHIFSGNRQENKQRAAEAALKMLKEYLLRRHGSKPRLEESAVVTCFLESDEEILLLRRSEKVGTYQGRWAGVSGYMEKSPDEQALTEIEEETGLSREEVQLIKRGEPLEVADEKIGRKWIVHPYLFHIQDRGKIRIDWEHKEARWIAPADIVHYETVPMLKEVLERVCNI